MFFPSIIYIYSYIKKLFTVQHLNSISILLKFDMKNYKKSLKLVNRIQKIRSKNNKNWMDILKLSLKLNPQSTSKILSKIYNDDKKISALAKRIYKINK